MKSFELTECEEVLNIIAASDPNVILAGGCAVAMYARQYIDSFLQLNRRIPLSFSDIDLICSGASGKRLAQLLNAEWRDIPGANRAMFSQGRCLLSNPTKLIVDILAYTGDTAINSLPCTFIVTSLSKKSVMRILHPILLYIIKGTTAVKKEQNNPSRPRCDMRQFVVMELVVRNFLRKLADDSELESANALIRGCERLLEFWLDINGAALVLGGAVNLEEVLPIPAMNQHSSKAVREFADQRLTHFFIHELPAATDRVCGSIAQKVWVEASHHRCVSQSSTSAR